MPSITSILVDDKHRGIQHMPDSDYRAVGRLNPSSIVEGFVGPVQWAGFDVAAVRQRFEAPEPTRTPAQQDQLDRGTLADMLLLTPGSEHARFAVWTGGRRQGAEWDGFVEANAGKTIMRKQDFDEVTAAVSAVRFSSRVTRILEDAQTHVAVFGREGDVFVKGQLDALCGRRIVDLKTTGAGLDPKSIERTIRAFHYREKLAMYRRWCIAAGRAVEKCTLLFMSLSPPYRLVRVDLTTSALEWAEERMLDAIARIEKAAKADEWPIYYREDMADVADWEIVDEADSTDWS